VAGLSNQGGAGALGVGGPDTGWRKATAETTCGVATRGDRSELMASSVKGAANDKGAAQNRHADT
jgi:hypothetical protein